jgi:hypothetical protein
VANAPGIWHSVGRSRPVGNPQKTRARLTRRIQWKPLPGSVARLATIERDARKIHARGPRQLGQRDTAAESPELGNLPFDA